MPSFPELRSGAELRRLSNTPYENLCFVNSAVQLLTHWKAFMELLDSVCCDCDCDALKSTCPCGLWRAFETSYVESRSPGPVVSAKPLLKWAASRTDAFQCGRMHDAVEFIEWYWNEIKAHVTPLMLIVGGADASDATDGVGSKMDAGCGLRKRLLNGSASPAIGSLIHRVLPFPLIQQQQEQKPLRRNASDLFVGMLPPEWLVSGQDEFLVHLAWHEKQPPKELLATWYCSVMTPQLKGDVALTAVVAYRGSHYMCAVLCKEGWLLLNDSKPVLVLGKSWAELAQRFYHSNVIPQLLLFARCPSRAPEVAAGDSYIVEPRLLYATPTKLSPFETPGASPQPTAPSLDKWLLGGQQQSKRERTPDDADVVCLGTVNRRTTDAPQQSSSKDSQRQALPLPGRVRDGEFQPPLMRSDRPPLGGSDNPLFVGGGGDRPLLGCSFIVFSPPRHRGEIIANLERLGGVILSSKECTRRMSTFVIIERPFIEHAARRGRLHTMAGFGVAADIFRNFFRCHTMLNEFSRGDRSAADLMNHDEFSISFEQTQRWLEISHKCAATGATASIQLKP